MPVSSSSGEALHAPTWSDALAGGEVPHNIARTAAPGADESHDFALPPAVNAARPHEIALPRGLAPPWVYQQEQ